MSPSSPARAVTVVAALTGTVLVLPLLAPGLAQDLWYGVVGLLCLLAVGLGILRHRDHESTHGSSWWFVLGGLTVWVAADWLSTYEQDVLHTQAYPLLSDGLYLTGYLVIAAGLSAMARHRRGGRDHGAILDASIIAAGVAVLAAAFVVLPIADDSTLSGFGKLVSTAYPVMDVLLLGLLLRLWLTPLARTASMRLLTAALGLNLLTDATWNVWLIVTGRYDGPVLLDMLWLAGYVCLAAAAWVPSMRAADERLPDTEARMSTGNRVTLLAVGLLLPAASLVVDGARGHLEVWVVAGLGSIVLSLLVLARMAGLLGTVQGQAVQLAALARSDALTGAPNRRTWDHELSRAARRSRDAQSPLCVALLDLDRFKRFNDTFGHQAGDLLLREAVAAWTEALEPGEMLARYGGEEFAVLLPDVGPDEAVRRITVLRDLVPAGQTFSAGVALWDRDTEPGTAVADADEALYAAKSGGRNRVVLADNDATDELPEPRIVVQPIVDLASGVVVAEEALSRFPGRDTAAIFEQVAAAGRGSELEIAAMTAAMGVRRADRRISVNTTLDALVTAGGHRVLPDDLSGVILEITEHGEADHVPGTDELLAALRARGCTIAIDDWGRGHSNLSRMLRLQPEVIKLDMSLVHGIDLPYHRELVTAMVRWSEEVGVRVCAEGIETAEQRDELLRLGVQLGQGYFLGRPEAPVSDDASALASG